MRLKFGYYVGNPAIYEIEKPLFGAKRPSPSGPALC